MLSILADALLIAARLDSPTHPTRVLETPAPAKKRGWFGFAR